MNIRGLLTIFLGNALAFLLIVVAAFLTVRFTSWGKWAVDSSLVSSAELARKHGDPVALLEKGVLIHQWVFGPVIAIAVGGLAAIVFRRSN